MNNIQNSSNLSPADLDWMAFQYVSGDLTADDTVRFEELLANDLSACEAVARHVMICETIATTPLISVATPAEQVSVKHIPQPTVTITKTSTNAVAAERSASRWAGVVSAAACLGLAVRIGLVSSGPPANVTALVSTNDQLVQYWVDMKQDVDESVDLVDSHSEELSVWSESYLAANDSELMPADWMLAAVSTSEMNDDADMPGEVIE